MRNIEDIKVLRKQVYNNPCPVRLTLGGCFIKNTYGENLFCCVNSGYPAILLIYNIDQGVCQQSIALECKEHAITAKRSYCVDCRDDGTLIIIDGCGVFTFALETGTLCFHGEISGESAVLHPGGFDEEGNYYFGTYPGAALFRFTKNNRLQQIGKHVVPGDYIRAMEVSGGNAYLGALNPDGNEQFYCFDLNSHKTTVIHIPEIPSCRKERCAWIPGIKKLNDDLIFVRLWFRKSLGAIWNIAQQRWVDVIDDQVKCTTTPVVDGNIYYFTSDGSCLCRRNIETRETKRYPQVRLPENALVYNMALVELRDQKAWPGKTIAANTTYYGLFLYNLQTGHWEIRENIGPEGHGKICLAVPGDNGAVFCSVYQGQYAGVFYPETGKLDRYAFMQVEGALYADSLYYMGRYLTDGGIASLDPAVPFQEEHNPQLLSTSKGSAVVQDRVFQIADTGEEIAYGSVPDYGLLGGCVAFWNKATGKTTLVNHTDIVPDQSIIGLTYQDGKLYGTTGIWGGLGILPKANVAYAFSMDAATHQVERRCPLYDIDGDPLLVAGGVSVSPAGKLYVASDYAILELDRDTLETIREIPVGVATKRSKKDVLWRAYNLEWLTENICVTNIAHRVYLVDTEAGISKEIYGDCYYLSMDKNKDLYVIPSSMSELLLIKLGENEPKR